MNEEAIGRVGSQRHKKKIYIDIMTGQLGKEIKRRFGMTWNKFKSPEFILSDKY